MNNRFVSNDRQPAGSLNIRSVHKITNYRHLNMFEICYEDLQGRKRTWQIASRNDEPKCATRQFDMPDAVVVVPHHFEEDKLVIIREFRVSVGDYQYGFPAGLMDPGETIEQTAVRELYEETGLTVTRMIKVSPPIYSSSGLTDESISMAYVECSGKTSKQGNTSSEDIYTLFVSPQEALDLCSNKSVKFDAKTWLVISEYARSGHVF
jgi:ADP-ribose pyrophosphatase